MVPLSSSSSITTETRAAPVRWGRIVRVGMPPTSPTSRSAAPPPTDSTSPSAKVRSRTQSSSREKSVTCSTVVSPPYS